VATDTPEGNRVSTPDEPFDGQNAQFGQQPPSGPTGNIPPAPYGQTPPYGQQPPPYGLQPSPYGPPATPPYGQAPYGQPSPWSQPLGPPPPNYLVWAILSTLFCCMPLGIVSIVYAAQVGSKWSAGDVAGAHHSSNQAKNFARWSALSILIIVGFYLVLAFVGGALEGFSG